MKKLLVWILCAMFSMIVLAKGDREVPENIESKFHQQFPEVLSAKWTKVGSFWVAEFVRDEHFTNAYFNGRSECVGYGRYLKPYEIPLLLHRMVAVSYEGWKVGDVFEYNAGSNTAYYVSLEKNGNRKMILSRDMVNSTTVWINDRTVPYDFPWSALDY